MTRTNDMLHEPGSDFCRYSSVNTLPSFSEFLGALEEGCQWIERQFYDLTVAVYSLGYNTSEGL